MSTETETESPNPKSKYAEARDLWRKLKEAAEPLLKIGDHEGPCDILAGLLRELQEAKQQIGVRWGTCVECPVIDGRKRPGLCVNTDRYDHQLECVGFETTHIARAERAEAALVKAEKQVSIATGALLAVTNYIADARRPPV